VNRLFRYSGNKAKLLSLYRPIPNGVARVVEPYLGSGAFSINSGIPAIGYEVNKDLYAVWTWLKQATAQDLHDLNDLVEDWKKRQEKPDVRDMKLDLGRQTYVRVNCCSVVVGQLSSWKVYPQHSLPIEETIKCLPKLRQIEVVHGRGEDHKPVDGDLLFVDPPYIGTIGNYQEKNGQQIEKEYDPKDTEKLLDEVSCPVIFTYGSNAKEIFPNYDWELIKTVKVPNMRKGGTVDRTEWAAYINFPTENTLF
jgi:site-specific DNA-adenine methylase